MSEQEDSVLAYWKEHREELRQSENQRAILTNYVLVITAAVSGFVVQQQFSLRTTPLSVLIVVIGLYGALAAAKYHERADYHLSQARALTRALVEAGAVTDTSAALQEARQAHYDRYPQLHRLRLYWLWTGLHLGIAVYGAVLLCITGMVR
jgi:prolipoprotein diacylglyceryltransferase